jgi:hypothetical protein
MLSGSPVTSLASGASATVVASYTITQNDLNSGSISMVASVMGKYPDGNDCMAESNQVTIYGLQNPQLNASLTASENSFKLAGQVINFTVQVKNAGNITLSGISLASDGDLNFNGNSSISLAPGRSATLFASYTIAAGDLDAGSIVKSITATSVVQGQQPVVSISNEIILTAIQNPELTTIASTPATSYTAVGEVIKYNILVTNSGNVSLISTALSDPNAVINSARPNTILLPGESFMAEASHIVTQYDIDFGKVTTATKAEGFDLKGDTITKLGNAVTVNAIQKQELMVSNAPVSPTFKQVGEIINYNLTVVNSGNVTLFKIGVADPNLVLNISEPVSSLLPGKTITAAAMHMVTQADMDAGEVVSQSKAVATDMNNMRVEKTGENVIVPGEQHLELSTTARTSVPEYKEEGDHVEYTVVVKNTGNVTMRDIYVTDAKSILNFKEKIGVLAPGETDSVKTIHRVNIEDINAGKIVTAGIANGYTLTQGRSSYMSNDVTVKLTIDNYNLRNFPNPFSYETTIVFDLPERGEVIMKIFDMTGREAAQIDKKVYNAGRNFVQWRTLEAQKGMYILKLYYNGDQAVKTMTITNYSD